MKRSPESALLRVVLASTLLAFLAACASAPPEPKGVYKVGNPYKINGTWYYPRVQPDYDEIGVASWYGPGFHGSMTANGERYNQNDLTAAHTTLPMPTSVRVTNLENGRSIVLRVNDRGPFAHGRIIDVSSRAAELLGFKQKGTARVRVQVLGPATDQTFVMAPAETAPEERVAAKAAPTERVAAAALDVPAGASAAPPPAPRPAVSSPEMRSAFTLGQVYVQVGAFADSKNAYALYNQVLGLGKASIAPKGDAAMGTQLYHVRLGPVADHAEAERLAASLRARGHQTAQLVVE